MNHLKKYITLILTIFLTTSFFSFAANAEELFIPTNGDYLSPIMAGESSKGLFQYKASLENYIESDEFKTAQPREREIAVKELITNEIADIGIRILSDLPAISNSGKSYLEENLGSAIENKIKSLRVAADVLRDSGYPELENLVTTGLLEAHDLYIFEYGGESLCEEHVEERCPAFKTMYLVDLIEKLPTEQIKNGLLEIIRSFSSLETIPSNPAVCLNPKDADKKRTHVTDSAMFCGMIRSSRVRKAIKNGVSYYSTGNQDPTHSCTSINLNLVKVQGDRGGLKVQVDPNKESFVVDSLGNRITITNTELKLIQEALE